MGKAVFRFSHHTIRWYPSLQHGPLPTYKSRLLHERKRLGHLSIQGGGDAAALLGRCEGGGRTGKESSGKEGELHGWRWTKYADIR